MKIFYILILSILYFPFDTNAQCSECPSGSILITGSTNIMEQNMANDYCITGNWTGNINQIANNSTVTFCPGSVWEMPSSLSLQQNIVITNYGTITDNGQDYEFFIQSQTDLINQFGANILVGGFENQDTEFTNHGSLIAENIYFHGPTTNSGTIESTADCGGNATTSCGFFIGNKGQALNNTGTITTVDANIRDAIIGGGDFISTGNISIENNGASTDNNFIVNDISFQASSNVTTGSFEISGTLDCNNANISTDICFTATGSYSTNCSNSTSTVVVCSVLPVNIIDFSIKQLKEKLVLTWEVGTEINLSHYEIEYSTDARQFENLTKIDASNNHYYQQVINRPSDRSVYLRLKMVDFDGSINHSDIIKINALQEIDYNISPNPTSAEQGLLIHFDEKQDVMISLYSFDGQLVSTKFYQDENVINFDLNQLNLSGLYLLKISTKNTMYTEEIFVR